MKKVCLSAVTLLFVVGCSEAQTVLERGVPLPGPTREEQVVEKLESLRADPDGLAAFLKLMPKGGDLRSYLSGAVSTESLIQWGAEDGVCVDEATFAAISPSPSPCDPGTAPLSDAMSDLELYSNVLKAWSLESYKGPMVGRHKHFLATFGRFAGAFGGGRMDDGVAEVMSTAAKNNQIYVELFDSLGASAVGEIASKYIKDGDAWDEAYLLEKRGAIMADPAFKSTINAYKAAIPGWVSGARKILGCETASADPGCGVDVRFLMSATRTKEKGYVFAEWVYGYELAQVAQEVVGVDLGGAEEDANALAYYEDEMAALDVLHQFNAGDMSRKPVHISLAAGALIQEVLPSTPEGQAHLTFHIRRAVELGHAERVGHGVDLAYESDGEGTLDLLDDMRRAGVMVEVCLESDNALLGTFGLRHPLHSYTVQGVPVALASDNQGVLRTRITDDYVRAVSVQGVGYLRLKEMARTSVEHSFLSGVSLWKVPDSFYEVVSECEFDSPTAKAEEISAGCTAFLAASERAAMQWKLEGGLEVFETSEAPETSP